MVTTLRARGEYLRKLRERDWLGAYTCDHCGQSFNDRDDYEGHVNSHHEAEWEPGPDAGRDGSETLPRKK